MSSDPLAVLLTIALVMAIDLPFREISVVADL
jgi:hypothetical protein